MRFLLLIGLLFIGISSELAAEEQIKPAPKPSQQTTSPKSPGQAGTGAPQVVVTVNSEVGRIESRAGGAEGSDKEDKHPPAEIFAWVATVGAAIVAGVALVVAIIQAGFFFWQLKIMGKANESAATAAKAALDTAKLTGDQFIATQRPRLILRDAYCLDNEIGHRIEVRYAIVNVGGSDARITVSTLRVELITHTGFGAHERVPLIDGRNDIGAITLAPGRGYDGVFVSDRIWRTDDESRHDFEELHFGVFFCGHLVYLDEKNVTRHTMFWRRYDSSESRFYRPDLRHIDAMDNAD